MVKFCVILTTPILDDLLSWGQGQLKIILSIILIITLFVTAFRRAWLAMVGTILAMAFLAMFVSDTTLLIDLAEWFAKKLKLRKT